LAFVVSAVGPTYATASLTAESAALLAQKNNPDLAAARNLIAEADARTRTTGRLANPELEGELAGGQDFEGRVSIGVTQRFPLTARLRLERDLSSIEFEMARLAVQERERQIAMAARAAFYELAAVRASMSLAGRQTALADAFARSISEGIAQGFGSQLDAQQATLAADTLRATEQSLRSEEIGAAAQLNGLLGRPADALISVSESLDLPKTIPAMMSVGERADLSLCQRMRIPFAASNRNVFVEQLLQRDPQDHPRDDHECVA
jgi:outer membrane protein TolC